MSTKDCCKAGRTPEDGGNRGPEEKRKNGRNRRWGRMGELVPGVLLVLMPKCPLCFAGYLSVATGIGVSFTTAKYLRLLLIALCVVSVTFFLVRRLLRPLRKG